MNIVEASFIWNLDVRSNKHVSQSKAANEQETRQDPGPSDSLSLYVSPFLSLATLQFALPMAGIQRGKRPQDRGPARATKTPSRGVLCWAGQRQRERGRGRSVGVGAAINTESQRSKAIPRVRLSLSLRLRFYLPLSFCPFLKLVF